MRQKVFIDSHKGVTPLAILAMMAVYGQWDNPTAWVYLGLHGSYGILWVLKSRIFGDRQWEQPTGWGYGLVIWGGLTLYWIAPWLITSQGVHAPPWLLGLSVFVYGFGVFLHFAADMQKHTSLALRPGQLITTGLFTRTRNPNYLGELLIYLSFAVLALHWAPLLVVALFLIVVWIPNMRRKDRSLARYPGFAAYKNRSDMLLPKLTGKREAVPGQTHRIG
jgi:protein-S-isoprenylcysteine O-methyltransferase Ste14